MRPSIVFSFFSAHEHERDAIAETMARAWISLMMSRSVDTSFDYVRLIAPQLSDYAIALMLGSIIVAENPRVTARAGITA